MDISDPTYTLPRFTTRVIPLTEVSGYFRSNLHTTAIYNSRNPTEGSRSDTSKSATHSDTRISAISVFSVSAPLVSNLAPAAYTLLMLVIPLTELSWAYQLHYYLCFRTYRRQQSFLSKESSVVLSTVVSEICNRHDYHLLRNKIYPDQLRCLISLRPDQCISKVVQVIKANASRECRFSSPLWARGFLAKSVGRMSISAVQQYLAQQAEHHGYAGRVLPPVHSYRAATTSPLRSPHSVFDLNYHLVFATFQRKGIFTSGLGQALTEYWLKVAARRGFAIDQLTIVPDHIHLLIRTLPTVSIEQCAFSLLNNAQHFVAQRNPRALVAVGLDQLWQPSAYAGTCGAVSTSLMKKWLSE